MDKKLSFLRTTLLLLSAIFLFSAMFGAWSFLAIIGENPDAIAREVTSIDEFNQASRDVPLFVNTAIANVVCFIPLGLSIVFFALARVLKRLGIKESTS